MDGKCTVCGAKDPNFKPFVIAGANGEWMKGEKNGLSFTSNTDILQVQVDGHDLGYENYEILENGTILTLNPEYLETLSAGKHTLTIVTNTGSTDMEFTVKLQIRQPISKIKTIQPHLKPSQMIKAKLHRQQAAKQI